MKKNKKCTCCKYFKNYSEFHKCSQTKDGHKSYCKICRKKKSRERYLKKDKALLKKERRERYLRDKEHELKRCHLYYRKNREHLLKKSSEWSKRNRDKKNSYCVNRRFKEREAKPNWVDENEIKLIYKYAKECQWLSEDVLEVDHIIPIEHDDVCGLHVPWNLQVITREMNRKKHNKFDGTSENISWRLDVEEN